MKKLLIIGLMIFTNGANAFSISFKLMPRKNEIKLYGSARMFMDGSTPASCNGYKNPVGNRFYSGDVGDGFYMIKPDSGAAFSAYCDMTTDASGWTLLMTGNMTANYMNPPASLYNGTSTESISFTVLNTVTLTQAQLMNVINRVPFTQIKLPFGYILNSTNSTNTFSQKYTALTSWTSTACNTAYGAVYGWNMTQNGFFTSHSYVLGCSVTSGSPDGNGGHIDFGFTGIGAYATSDPACVDQGGYYVGCGNRWLVGSTNHRQTQSFHSAGAVSTKQYLIWIK